jgi:ribosomal protein S18 acetylase RimI-like enzyme
MKRKRTRTRKATPPAAALRAATRLGGRTAAAFAPGVKAMHGDGIAIRPAQAADIAQVIALDAQITGIEKSDYWRGIYQRFIKQRQQANEKDQFFLVAAAAAGADAGSVLGFIRGEIRAWEFGSAPCGWAYALSVRPDARLRGIGQALLDGLTTEFKKSGVTRMRTMVARDNRLHLLFFRASGMTAGPYIELERDLT